MTFPRPALAVLVGAFIAVFPGARARAQAGGDYLVGTQDVLNITVFEQAELSGRYTVEADGSFTFPLVGRVKAGGRTLRQFESDLKRLLADGFFLNPQVAVAVEQYRSQRIFVVGEVRQPGSYALTGDMTVVETLARAGSTTSLASGEVVIVRGGQGARPTSPGDEEAAQVIRVSVKELESGNMRMNVQLRDGDTVFVPRAESLFVFGEVKNPGVLTMQPEMTVRQALAVAGGATEQAATNRIRIVRIINGRKQDLKVKLEDLVLPGDTIVVPVRYF
jgi:polysaccharide export outer membrane protein